MPCHVQEGFLLTGKRRVGQVFGGGGRAHGKGGVRVVAGQNLAKAVRMALLQSRREGLSLDPEHGSRHRFSQGTHVFGVQGGQTLADAVSQAIVLQELAKAWAVVAKPVGTRTPLGSCEIISPRLAFLPPTTSTSVIAQLLEGDDQGGRLKAVGHRKLQDGKKSGGALSEPAQRPGVLVVWPEFGHVVAGQQC
jgi:hypothetical protein